jgi:hypothetical protein
MGNEQMQWVIRKAGNLKLKNYRELGRVMDIENTCSSGRSLSYAMHTSRFLGRRVG